MADPLDPDQKLALVAKVLRSLDPEARRQDFEQRLESDPVGTISTGRKRAALRYFLQQYRGFKPGVLTELAEIGKQPDFVIRDFRAFARKFFLPNSPNLAMECTATLAAWSSSRAAVPPDRWHFETPHGRYHGLYIPAAPYEFTFRAPGWDPPHETLAEARRRLKTAFRAQLRAQSESWRELEEARAEFRAFVGSASERDLRNLQWLAEKQALGVGYGTLAKRDGGRPEKVHEGIRAAAGSVGLSQAELRKGKPGRPRSK